MNLTRKIERLERAAGVGTACTTCGLPLDAKLRDQAIKDERRVVVRYHNYDGTPPPDDGPPIECEACGMGTALVVVVEYSDQHVTFKHDGSQLAIRTD